MKVEIPNELKTDLPQSNWGKILGATPVVMTVLATMLAGLASSEMTRAQYNRATAAQLQSKAGDQWGFFQAKRLRGATQRNAYDLLLSLAEVRPVSADAMQKAGMKAEASNPALQQFINGQLPPFQATFVPSGELKEVLQAIEASRPEAEISPLILKLPDALLDQAFKSARADAQSFEEAVRPVNRLIEELDAALAAGRQEGMAGFRDFTAARVRFASLRYEAEARLNQAIAGLYEVQVRQKNLAAERHHARSQRFFYGMLAAQAAVIIATFAMAARKRNLLWSLAAAAGLAALALGIYVYVYV